MNLLRLAGKSALNRKVSLSLSVVAISVSLLLILMIDVIGKQSKRTFLQTVSQTDLIVGARGGPLNLLLYSVFHIGDATNNVRYESYQKLAKLPQVKWAVPLALGDSHKGFRVVGTSREYFQYYRYADKQALAFTSGTAFSDLYDVVVGASVAKSLGYTLGEKLVVSHGMIETDYSQHDDQPFRISGILQPTGTPVDKSVLVSLEAIEAIHVGWQSGTRSPLPVSPKMARQMNLQPKTITAAMLGLQHPVQTFKMQRQINTFADEPLQAILPGATLAKLWQTLGKFEQVLQVVSWLVLVTGLVGLLSNLLSTLNERQREMAVLRAIGAHAYQVVLLFVVETLLVVGLSILFAVGFLYGLLYGLQPLLAAHYGVYLSIEMLDTQQWLFLGLAMLLAVVLSVIPGWLAYQKSLIDGLKIRT